MRAVAAEDVRETRGLVPSTMFDLDGCNMRVSRQLEVPDGTDARKQTNKTNTPVLKQANKPTNKHTRTQLAACNMHARRTGVRACYLHHLIHSFTRASYQQACLRRHARTKSPPPALLRRVALRRNR
jgi:hypothetical protein